MKKFNLKKMDLDRKKMNNLFCTRETLNYLMGGISLAKDGMDKENIEKRLGKRTQKNN